MTYSCQEPFKTVRENWHLKRPITVSYFSSSPWNIMIKLRQKCVAINFNLWMYFKDCETWANWATIFSSEMQPSHFVNKLIPLWTDKNLYSTVLKSFFFINFINYNQCYFQRNCIFQRKYHNSWVTITAYILFAIKYSIFLLQYCLFSPTICIMILSP